MTLKEYQSQLHRTLIAIKELLEATGYFQERESTELRIDDNNPSQVFDKEEANRLQEKLYSCYRKGEYLISPIEHSGEIIKTASGQYELEGITLDCGTILEVKLFDQQEERWHFVYTTIECDNKGYFLTCNGTREIEGLEARLR